MSFILISMGIILILGFFIDFVEISQMAFWWLFIFMQRSHLV
jgi:TRAP-type mannitol/chloroaromatic compound transport system permease large subunit